MVMPAKVLVVPVVRMSVTAMPTRIIWPGKGHAQLVMADIAIYPSIRHIINLSNNKVQGTQSSIKVEAS
jgi:hypothetical protein